MIIEAPNKKELEGGMKSLLISFAWKARARDLESVFEGRYHLTVLKNPTQTRNALRYVLLNEEKHRGFKLSEIKKVSTCLYQTSFLFKGWRDLVKSRHLNVPVPTLGSEARAIQLLMSAPNCWLMREGWKLAA